MAIGTGLAILGAAGISAVGSALGSKSQTKAAKDVANTTAADNAANRQFLEGIYNKNVGYLSPWMQSGQTANNAFMELLGFPAQPAPSAFAAMPQQMGMPVNGYNGGSAFSPIQIGDNYGGFTANNAMGVRNLERLRAQQPQNPFTPTMNAPPVPGAVTAQPSARSAFDTYRNSTGYDFRFGEGTRALQSAFSRNLESGAAVKSALRFGQGIASDEFARYMQLLGDQSRLGLSGASALAGVGQNFGNTVVAGNQAATSAAANARLYAGQSNANMWQGLGSSFGNALGYLVK